MYNCRRIETACPPLRLGYLGTKVTCRPKKSRTWLVKAKSSDSPQEDGGRLANLLEKYRSEEDQENNFVSSTVNRGEKKKRYRSKSSFTKGVEENQKKHNEYFYRVVDGTWKPRVGVHGKGEPQWWALRVTIGREKQTCTAIERRYQQLREAASPDDAKRMQDIETWDVWKRVRAWNPKSEKMGNKMIRYEGGGWVMLRAIMDIEIANILKGNINILGFHHREVYNGVEFPIPVSDELIDSLTEWQENLEPISEEQVREELGLPPRIPDSAFFELEDVGHKKNGKKDRWDNRKSQGLFSSSDDGIWDEGNNSWYSGSVSSDENSINSSWMDDHDGFNTIENENDAEANTSDELTAWLGDFSENANDDWSTLEEEDQPSSKKGSDLDDLSWWDDTTNTTEEITSEINERFSLIDEDTLPSDQPEELSTSKDESSGVPIEIIRGAFKDFEGTVLEDNAESEKIKAEIDVFGRPTVIEVLREDLRYL